MIKCTGFFWAGILLLGGCATSKNDHTFILKGKTNGLPAGSVVLVRIDPADRTMHTMDSVPYKDGQFKLEGEIERPEQMIVRIMPGNWSFSVFIEPGEIAVEVDTTNANHYDYTAIERESGAWITQYTVKGSANHNILNAHENHPENIKFRNQLNATSSAYQSATTDEQKDAARAESHSISKKRSEWELQFIDSLLGKQPGMVATALLFDNYYQFNQSMSVADLEKRIHAFQAPADSSGYVLQMKAELAKHKAIQPGQVAPDFTALKPDSTEFSLSSLRGKYVLIDFWASWCVPCRQAIPHWKEVYAKYHNKGFQILGLTNDSRWSDWFKALDVEKMPWIQVADDFPVKNMPARIAELYVVPSLPTYVLLDKEGKVIVHTTDKKRVDEELNKIFM